MTDLPTSSHPPSPIQATDTDPAARLEQAIRLYTELGFPPERTVAQLVIAGHAPAMIRARFPDVPESAYPTPRSKREPREQKLRDITAKSAAAGKGVFTPPSAGSVLESLPAARRPAITNTTAKPSDSTSALLTSRAATSSGSHQSSAADIIEPSAGISFQYVPLIQCSFPHADPGDETTFSRRNGWLELTLSATRRDTGLPYGVPARLLTIYCASEAIRSRSPEIFLGNSVHDFLRQLDIPITRGERGSLRVYANQLLRLIHCAVSIDENIRDASGRTGLHIRQALFAEEARLWWDDESGVGRGSSLVLSSVLFQSILERCAPLSTHAIRHLRKSPMDLDVYAWLVHRLFNLNRPSTISWEQLSGQFGHGYAEQRKFRHFFLDSLRRVLTVYPEAKAKPSNVGLLLLPSKPHVARAPITKM